jgi:hypothetical protein
MRHENLLCLAMLIATSATPAFAYDGHGHQVVGALADALLKPEVKRQVNAILGTSLRVASNWADCVKSVSPDFKYTLSKDYVEFCGAFEDSDGIKRMEDYAKRNWDNCGRKPDEPACHKQYHYADVAEQHDQYNRQYIGTSDHDVVSAINASIAVLQGKPAPSPFSIKDKREALLLLAHFVGDLHQPLHVGAIYLDSHDQPFDPDASRTPSLSSSTTQGANLIDDNGSSLHKEWDTIPATIDAASLPADMVADAMATPRTTGDVSTWAAVWATESLQASRTAFANLSFARGPQGHWEMKVPDHARYIEAKETTQRHLLAEAGARLATLLNTVLDTDASNPPRSAGPAESH